MKIQDDSYGKTPKMNVAKKKNLAAKKKLLQKPVKSNHDRVELGQTHSSGTYQKSDWIKTFGAQFFQGR